MCVKMKTGICQKSSILTIRTNLSKLLKPVVAVHKAMLWQYNAELNTYTYEYM